MRIAAIYDIHGNLPALEAVLEEIAREGVDQIVVGGDVVPGPMPRKCMAAVMALSIPVQCIHGNGESNILAVNRGELLDRVPERLHDAMHWVERRLPPEYLAEFAAWPLTLRLAHPEIGDILFCHATPRDDTEIFTRITPEGRLRALFDAANADLVVCGHTHMQFDRFVGSTRVINSGSVGMPYGERGAHWLLIDSDVRFRRTEYDYDGAAARIHETEFPGAHEFARLIVFSPPAELEMTERLESAAIGR